MIDKMNLDMAGPCSITSDENRSCVKKRMYPYTKNNPRRPCEQIVAKLRLVYPTTSLVDELSPMIPTKVRDQTASVSHSGERQSGRNGQRKWREQGRENREAEGN